MKGQTHVTIAAPSPRPLVMCALSHAFFHAAKKESVLAAVAAVVAFAAAAVPAEGGGKRPETDALLSSGVCAQL